MGVEYIHPPVHLYIAHRLSRNYPPLLTITFKRLIVLGRALANEFVVIYGGKN